MTAHKLSIFGASTLAALALARPAHANVHLDDGAVEAWLYTFDDGSKGSHYIFKINIAVWGDAELGEHDAVKVAWKSKGKVVGEKRCELERNDKKRKLGTVVCEYGRDQTPWLQAYGDIDVDLTYIDDAHDKTQPLRPLHVKVGRYWDWTGMDGKKPHHAPHFQIIGDELLGASLLYLPDDPNSESNPYGPVAFEFWTAIASTTGAARRSAARSTASRSRRS